MDDESTKVGAKAFFALCCDFYLFHKRTREKNFTHCDGKCLHLANEICNWVENSEIQLCDDALGLRFSIHESLSNYRVWKKNSKSRLHLSRQKRSLKRDFEKLTPFSEPFFDIGPLFICISSSIEFVVVIALNLIRFPHFKRFIVNDSFHRLKTLVTKVIEHIAWMKMCFESSDAS